MQANHVKNSSPGVRIIDSFPNPTAVKYNQALWNEQHGDNIVIINCLATDIYFPEHWSPLSVKCAFNGREYYHFKDKSLAVCDANFLILNEGAVYSSSISTKAPTESLTLNFTAAHVSQAIAAAAPTIRQMDSPFEASTQPLTFVEKLYPHNELFSQILLKLRNMIRENEMQGEAYLELLYAALDNMIQVHRTTDLEIECFQAVRRSTKEEMYKRLTLARDYIESCFSQDISLHRLSRVCLVNPHYLLRQFKKFYQITPHQYLMRRRLQEAESLLKTETTVSELARLVGFSDPSSFSKLFKRYYGQSPEKYREKNPGIR